MKIRFGALALVAMLAACSSQDQTATGDAQKGSQASATSPGVGAAISGYSNDSKRTLGNAPDRGELFGYKKGAAVLHKGAYTLRPIALSEEHAIRGVATGMMTLPGPNGEQIKIRYQRHEESPDGNWSWIGRVVGGDASREAIITFGEHAVFGSIPQANGPSLQLTTERGIAYLVQADASRLLRGVRAGGDAKVPAAYGASSARETESLVASATQKIHANALGVSPKAFTAANTVDLVAGYSNGLATRLGGPSVAVTKLVNLVAAANAALTNSNINGQIRLVNALQVNYADNTDNGTTLDQLTGSNGTAPVTVPASLAPLRAARETYGADLVTLVRDFKSENNGCGIAWLLGANQSPITIAGDAPFAYSVVSEGSYDLGGSTYYCEDITLIHELAHNMGSAHDLGNAGGNSGRYPYSYGNKTAAAQGNFFTVMAYGDNNQTLYRVFSNPLITTCGGLACGVANQVDNARSLNQTIPVVATFRANVVPFPNGGANDINADGRSDLFLRYGTSGGFAGYWIMNGASIVSASSALAAPANHEVAAKGDFNGDSRLDVLWYRASDRNLVLWQGNATGGFDTVGVGGLSPGWLVSGAGDINGDGRSDLFLRYGTSGGFAGYWIMNGASIVSASSALAAPANHDVAARGDFNGDGRLDVLWYRASDRNLVLWQGNTTGGFDTIGVGGLSPGWLVSGAGDINADGRSDLFLRYGTSGGFAGYWIMNGASIVSASSALAAPANHEVAAKGDFNGDGRLDVLWYRASDRNLALWQGNATGGFDTVGVGGLSSGWTVSAD